MLKINKKQTIGVTTLVIVISALSFLFGTHWQATIGMHKVTTNSINDLFCLGHNNFTETFQYNCYSPTTSSFKGFKSHLKCTVLTNHQMNTSSGYNELLTIKANYLRFTLDFNSNMTKVTQSAQPGESKKEPYAIIMNNDDLIHGMRTTKISDFPLEIHDFITLSKKTGKGMLSWVNAETKDDSLTVEYFQCD